MASVTEPGTRHALYARVSTEDQQQAGTIEGQLAELRRWCELRGIEPVDVYADDGVSGTVPFEQRPQGARLLVDATARRFDTVLVYRFDRLSRLTVEMLRTVQAFAEIGVSVQSISELIDSETPAGQMMLAMIGSFAQYERASFRQRSIDGMRRVAAQGKWPSGNRTPFGTRRNAGGGLEYDPVTREIVREVFALCHDDGLTLHQVSNYMAAQQRPGAPWSPTKVHRILTNEAYATGQVAWRKRKVTKTKDGRVVVGRYAPEDQAKLTLLDDDGQPLIDAAVFEAVQRRLRANFENSPRNTKRVYLLRNVLRCARCGGRMHGMTTRAGNRYYKCTGRNIGDPDFCRGAILPANIIEEAIWADIVEWAENPERPIAAILQQRAAGEHQRGEALKEHERLGAEIEEKQGSRAEVIRWARQKRITEDEMEQQLEEIAAEVRALQAKRHAITVRLAGEADYDRRVNEVEELLAEVREAVQGATPERKRDLVGKLARRIEVGVERDGRRLAAVNITTTWVFQRDCFTQRKPRVNGWASSPVIETARPSRT